jgi:hypothetical protein
VDIGQAMALDFQAVGLTPKLVEIDFPRVRELYRTKAIHGALFPSRHALRALDTIRILHKARDSVGYWYEHPFIEERLEALSKVVDRAERARLLREIGDHKFNEFAEIPLFWLFAEAAVNPKYVAEYTFPGVITGFFTHLEYVKLAPWALRVAITIPHLTAVAPRSVTTPPHVSRLGQTRLALLVGPVETAALFC